MLNEAQEKLVAGSTRTLQIVVAALCAGILVYGGIVFSGTIEQAEEPSIPVMLGVGMALGALVLQAVVPRLLVQAQLKALVDRPEKPSGDNRLGDAEDLAGLFTTKTIVGCALLEAPAFANLFFYSSQGQAVSAFSTAAMLVAMFFYFPTTDGVRAWVEQNLQALSQLRGLE